MTVLSTGLRLNLAALILKGRSAMTDSANAVADRLVIYALVYPGFTLLDLAGPQAVLSALPNADFRLVAAVKGRIVTDTGMVVLADAAMVECDAPPTVLLVPGGGQVAIDVLRDRETLDWVARVGADASWITSVCTGSLILGAADLLRGYRATSHWAAREFLSAFGATPVNARVVIDRNRMTGGGVTAGTDFALSLAAQLTCAHQAKVLQLAMEYAPQPPFDAGLPEMAGPEITAAALAHLGAAKASEALLGLAKCNRTGMVNG